MHLCTISTFGGRLLEDPLGSYFIACICFIFSALLCACESGVKHANEEKVASAGSRIMRYVRENKYPLATLGGLRTLLLMAGAAEIGLLYAMTPWGVLLVSALCMLIVMPVCILFPNRLCKRHADSAVIHLKPLILLVCVLLKPFALFSVWLSDALLRMLGNDTQDKEAVTEEEILALVDIGEESGVIEQSEHEMITNVLEFTDMTAADCMTHRRDIDALWIGDDDDTILATIKESGRSRLPVYDKDIDDVIGILFSRDYFINAHSDKPLPIRSLLREPYFVPKTVKTDVLLRNMQRAKTHIAIVLDEFGGLSGLVTMEDLLEEIVGNIYDEFDPQEEKDIVLVEDNVWQVLGSADLESLSEEMQVTLPQDEDYDTIGGLIFSRFNAIPDDGATPEVDIWCTADGEMPEYEDDEAEENLLCDLLHVRVDKILDHRVEKATLTVLRDQIVPREEDDRKTDEDDQ